VIGTHVVSGTPAVAHIGAPAITTDIAGAREYATRVAHQEKNRQ
jgi:hypothetical protein